MNVTIKEVPEPKYVMELELTKEELSLLGDIGNFSGIVVAALSDKAGMLFKGKEEHMNILLTQIWGAERAFIRSQS